MSLLENHLSVWIITLNSGNDFSSERSDGTFRTWLRVVPSKTDQEKSVIHRWCYWFLYLQCVLQLSHILNFRHNIFISTEGAVSVWANTTISSAQGKLQLQVISQNVAEDSFSAAASDDTAASQCIYSQVLTGNQYGNVPAKTL